MLVAFGVTPELKAALYDHWLSIGDVALEAFANAVEEGGDVNDACAQIPRLAAELYLRRYHAFWQRGAVTQAFWKPRLHTGSGIAAPLGRLSDPDGFGAELRAILPRLQADTPPPEGILMVSKNGHFGGREETISFDIVVEPLEAAVSVALSEGRQHTLPGSVGETSGTVDEEGRVALLWEIQPNVYKPSGDRNRSIAPVWRRQRNWHRVTLAAALMWLRDRGYRIAIIEGAALRDAHEVNPREPISEAIMSHHDATVGAVAAGLGLSLQPADPSLWFPLMNHALQERHRTRGGDGILRRVGPE